MAFAPEVYTARLGDASLVVLREPQRTELDQILPYPRTEPTYGLTVGDSERFWYEPDAELLYEELTRTREKVWGIEAYGRIVGYTGTWRILPYPAGYVYILDPTMQGKGIGSRVRAMITNDLFTNNPDLLAVEAVTHPLHGRSIRMLRSLGFQMTEESANRDIHNNEGHVFMMPRPGVLWKGKPPELTRHQTVWARHTFARRLASYAITKTQGRGGCRLTCYN